MLDSQKSILTTILRKRGGPPGKYGQVHWEDFDTLDDAEKWAQTWQSKGYTKKYDSCFYR